VARQRAALAAQYSSSLLTRARSPPVRPAIDALKECLAAYPGELDAATTLATL